MATHVFDPVGDVIPPDDWPCLTEVVRRLRPLAEEAVNAELPLRWAVKSRPRLGDRLDRMLEEFRRSHTEAS